MNLQELSAYLSTAGLNIGLKIIGALAALVIGRWLIRLVVRPFAENRNYQQVLFDTNRMLAELLSEKCFNSVLYGNKKGTLV